jgi:hypothetical protein
MALPRATLKPKRVLLSYSSLSLSLSLSLSVLLLLLSDFPFLFFLSGAASVDGEHLSYKELMYCGIFASLAQCVIVCPMELVKTRLQVITTFRREKHSRQCAAVHANARAVCRRINPRRRRREREGERERGGKQKEKGKRKESAK